LDRRRDELKGQQTFTQKTLEGMGIFKERTNAKNALLIEDVFLVAAKHLEQVSSYVGLAKPLRYAKLLLNDTEFQENVTRAYPDYLENLKRFLKVIEDDSINLDNMDQLTVELINKLDPALLGLHIFVAFKQPLSYIAASTQIDIKYLRKAFVMKTNYQEIKDHSPQTHQRLEGFIMRELGELGNVGKVSHLFLHKSPLNNKVLSPIKKADSLTIGKIWNATKLETKDLYPDLKGDEYWEKVTDRAEEIIRRTQPTWHPKDRSEIGRTKSVWMRLLTKYTSQRNKNVIITHRAKLEYNRSEKKAKDKARLIKKLATIFILNSLLVEAVNELRRKAYGNESRTVWEIALDSLSTALGNYYVIGDVFKSLISKIKYGTYLGYDTGNVVTSYMDTAIDGIAETYKIIDELSTRARYKSGDKKGELKYKTTALRAMDKNASTLLALKGLPYNNVKKLVAGLISGAWKMAGNKEKKTVKSTAPKGYGGKPISKSKYGGKSISKPKYGGNPISN
jgi:hypothetical protein